jgi:hypothetical protein
MWLIRADIIEDVTTKIAASKNQTPTTERIRIAVIFTLTETGRLQGDVGFDGSGVSTDLDPQCMLKA